MLRRLLLPAVWCLAVIGPVTAPAAAQPSVPYQVAARDASVVSTIDELIATGKRNMAAGQFEQALSNFQEADALAPEDEEIVGLLAQAQAKAADKYVAQGQALIKAKKYEEAIFTFESALELAPEHAAAKKGHAEAEKLWQEQARKKK